MKILVIIPAYNEADNIEKLLKSIKKLDIELDILVVNDASIDDTTDIVKNCNIQVQVVDLPTNLGIGGAVQTGFVYAYHNNYDIAIQVDGDGQHDPAFIKDIILPIINKDADMVIGSRFIKKEGFQSSFFRRMGIKFFQFLIKLLVKERFTDPTSGFRACNRNVIKEFVNYYPIDYPEPESLMILKRKRYKVIEVPVIMSERKGGASSIRAFQTMYYMYKVTMAIIIDFFRKY